MMGYGHVFTSARWTAHHCDHMPAEQFTCPGAALHMTGCGAGHQSCADLGSLVDVCHRGQVTLKGVPLPIVVMTLTPLILSGRMFPASLPGSSKSKLMAESKGLQCSVRLPVSRSL